MIILEMSTMIQAKRLKVYSSPHCVHDLPTCAGSQPFFLCTATAKELLMFSDVRKLCQFPSYPEY